MSDSANEKWVEWGSWRGLARKPCPEDPILLAGQPLGQYHCPGCGVMCVAGVPHSPPDEPDGSLYEECTGRPWPPGYVADEVDQPRESDALLGFFLRKDPGELWKLLEHNEETIRGLIENAPVILSPWIDASRVRSRRWSNDFPPEGTKQRHLLVDRAMHEGFVYTPVAAEVFPNVAGDARTHESSGGFNIMVDNLIEVAEGGKFATELEAMAHVDRQLLRKGYLLLGDKRHLSSDERSAP